jgi:hypothetical protein
MGWGLRALPHCLWVATLQKRYSFTVVQIHAPKPWEFQPGIDTYDSYAAFIVYLDCCERHIPGSRRLRCVSQITHTPLSTIRTWSKADLWVERATERMLRVFGIRENAIEDEYTKEGKKVAQEWLETVRLQKAVVDDQTEKLLSRCLEQGEGTHLRTIDLIRLSKETLHSERLLRGQATEIVGEELDLSKLTDEQLAAYEALTRLAKKDDAAQEG